MKEKQAESIVPYVLSNYIELAQENLVEYNWNSQKIQIASHDKNTIFESLSGTMTKTGLGTDCDDIEVGM